MTTKTTSKRASKRLTIEELANHKHRKTLNKDLLLREAKSLRRLRHEEHYRQSTFFTKTVCGTACCIAGRILLHQGMRPAELLVLIKDGQSLSDMVGGLVGLTGDEADVLFSGSPGTDWPDPFGYRWRNIGETGERPSKIAADFLEAIAQGKIGRNA
jgi:hypothetical protein